MKDPQEKAQSVVGKKVVRIELRYLGPPLACYVFAPTMQLD
jgi:hypothetical protein